MKKENIINILKSIIIDNNNIIDSGMLDNIDISEKKIIINIISYKPIIHIKEKLKNKIINSIKKIYSKIEILVDIKFIINKKKHNINNIKNVIAIASGKGGVGKSTISTNIAILLSKMDFKVGIIDADIYGPSIPIMFNVEKLKPNYININGDKKIKPIKNYNIKILSIGFFAEENQAILWRGPMASKAIYQFINDTYWGELDFLIIDLPPGTGDIHLSIIKQIPITGAIIISTPQKIAISDVKKAISMFKIDSIKIPILGIIENMSFFTPEELPEKKYYLFGKNGVKSISKKLDLNFLGEIPILQSIRESSDSGIPITLKKYENINSILLKIIKNIIKQLSILKKISINI